MNFGEAVAYAKEGGLVARKGWNGKRMFVFARPADTVPVQVIKSIPLAVKDYYAAIAKTEAQFGAYLCLKAADDSIVNGWLASQTDMLADDWGVFVLQSV